MAIRTKKINLSRVSLINGDVRYIRWVSPEETFQVDLDSAPETLIIPLDVRISNLPSGVTFSIIDGVLPSGMRIEGATLVGENLDPAAIGNKVFNVTIRAQSSVPEYFADRTFKIVVTEGEYDFKWITPAGLVDGDVEGTETSVRFLARDPHNLPVSYTRVSGPLPTGTILNSNGTLVGTYPEVSEDRDFTFQIEAFNGFKRIVREFTISVWDRPSEEAPEWITPKGVFAELYEGEIIDAKLEAMPSESNPDANIIYTVVAGSPPAGASFEANGIVYGLLEEVDDDTLFRIVVGASADSGNTFNKRLFEIRVKQNWPPEWVTDEFLKGDVEGYPIENIVFEATDRNSPDQSVSYQMIGGQLPTGLFFDGPTATLSGTMPDDVVPDGDSEVEYSFTIRASDGLKWSDKSFNIKVLKNYPPVFNGGGGGGYAEYASLEGDFLATTEHPASDPNNKPLTYAIESGTLPPDFVLDPATGVVSGILPPAPTEDVHFDFVLSASDIKHKVTQQVRIISWTNTPPVWITETLKHGLEGKTYQAQLEAVDRERRAVTYKLIGGNVPRDISVESSGRVVGIMPLLSSNSSETYTLVVEASDGIMSNTATIALENQKNVPPVWITPAGEIGSVLGQKNFKFSVLADEPNEQEIYYDLLSITRSNQDGREQHNDIERWNFNTKTGEMTGYMPHTFTEDVTYTIRVAALDGDHPYQLYPQVVRTFTFVRKVNTYPVWTTGVNLIDQPEGSDVHVRLDGYDPEGLPVIYYRNSNIIYREHWSSVDPEHPDDPPRHGGWLTLRNDTVVGKLPYKDKDFVMSFSVSLDDKTRSSPYYYRTPRRFLVTSRYNRPPIFLSPFVLAKRVEGSPVSVRVRSRNLGNVETMLITLKSGQLPPGLTMTPDGLISGIMPTITGSADENFDFVLTADNSSKTTDELFRITVEKNIAPYWVTPAGSLGSFHANVPTNVQLKAEDPNEGRGNPLVYSVTGGSLPAGMFLNTRTGLLSGTLPIEPFEKTYSFDITVSDGMYSAVQSFTITSKDNAPPYFISNGTIASPFDEERINTRVVAFDPEMEDLVYRLSSGSTLPGDLVLEEDGRITGNTGSVLLDTDYPFSVEVSDSFHTVTTTLNIRVVQNLPPYWITAAGRLGSYIAGGTYSIKLEGEDPNDQDISFYWLGGKLPAGSNVSEDGTITLSLDRSEPSRIYSIVVGISDGRFMVAQHFEISVLENTEPQWITDNGADGLLFSVHVNETVSYQLQASDDHDTLSFSITDGNLPSGLTMDQDGLISGHTLYAEEESFSFTVEVSDGSWEVSRTFVIDLLNDAPVWVTENYLGEKDEFDVVNVQLEAYDPEGAEITYELDGENQNFSVTPQGLLTGIIPGVFEDGFISVDVIAFDGFVKSPRTFSFYISFISPPRWLSGDGEDGGNSIGSGTEQYPFSTRLIALANNQSITYTVVAGAFPNTLTLDSDGLIHGTLPPVDGDTTLEFEVEAEAADGKKSSAIVSIDVKENIAPRWETPSILPDMPHGTKNYSINFVARDANNTPLTYWLVSGTPPFPIDFGTDNSYAIMKGDLPVLTGDKTWNFTIGADDGFIRTEREFTVLGLENKAPVWVTPQGIIASVNERNPFTAYIFARDETTVTYSIVSDNFPVNDNNTKMFVMDNNGKITGNAPEVFGTEIYTFVARASDGEKWSEREFKIEVKNNVALFDPFSQYVAFLARAEAGSFDDINPSLVPSFIGSADYSSGEAKWGSRSFFGANNDVPSFIQFDGAGDISPFQLRSSTVPEWTWDLWLYQNTTGGTQYPMFVGDPTDADTSNPKIGFIVNSGLISFMSSTGPGAYSFTMSLGELPNSRWTHVAVSRSKDGALHGFINGAKVATRPNSNILDTSIDGNIIVRMAGSTVGQNNWLGYIDDVRLTQACRYTENFRILDRAPVPPIFDSSNNLVVASGTEATEPTSVIPLVGRVLDLNALVTPRYQSHTQGYTVSNDGKLVFAKFPPAKSAQSNEVVKVSVLDSNGNLSRPNNAIIRSTAAFVPNLLAQWRFSENRELTLGSGILDDAGTGNGMVVIEDGEYAISMTTQMQWTTNNISSQMNEDFTVEFWTNLNEASNGNIFRLGDFIKIEKNGVSISATIGSGSPLTGAAALDGWMHIALERANDVSTIYINGVAVDSVKEPISNAGANGVVKFNDTSTSPNLYRAVSIWSVARYVGNFDAEWPGYGSDENEPKWLTKGDLGVFENDEEFFTTLNYRDPNNQVTHITHEGDLPMGVQFNQNDMSIGGVALAEATTVFSITVTLHTATQSFPREFYYTVKVPRTGVEWITTEDLGEFDGGSGIQITLIAEDLRDK